MIWYKRLVVTAILGGVVSLSALSSAQAGLTQETFQAFDRTFNADVFAYDYAYGDGYTTQAATYRYSGCEGCLVAVQGWWVNNGYFWTSGFDYAFAFDGANITMPLAFGQPAFYCSLAGGYHYGWTAGNAMPSTAQKVSITTCP